MNERFEGQTETRRVVEIAESDVRARAKQEAALAAQHALHIQIADSARQAGHLRGVSFASAHEVGRAFLPPGMTAGLHGENIRDAGDWTLNIHPPEQSDTEI